MKWNLFKHNPPYPADHFSKSYIEEVLDSIHNKHNLAKIPAAFLFLSTSSDDLKARTIKVLHRCSSKLENRELLLLDTLFREHSKDFENGDLTLPAMTDDEMVSILGLCTFHPNGYVREEALNELSSFETGTVVRSKQNAVSSINVLKG